MRLVARPFKKLEARESFRKRVEGESRSREERMVAEPNLWWAD